MKMAEEDPTKPKLNKVNKIKTPEKTESAISPDFQVPSPGMQGAVPRPLPSPLANAHKQVVPKVPTPNTNSYKK